MNKGRKIDHIVYGVHDLDTGCDHFEKLLGIRPSFGGYHRTQGTKNALLNLGDGCYLELLAIDESNAEIKAPRWMGIDLLGTPRIIRWAIKSIDLENDSKVLQTVNSEMGTMIKGARKAADGSDLSWEMTLPLASPEVVILPFMLDWGTDSNHPTTLLQDGCRLLSISGTHPAAEAQHKVLDELGVEFDLVEGSPISLRAKIESPNGIVEI